MSGFKFNTASKQRIAHQPTTSSAALIKDLEHKKQSMAQALSSSSSSSSSSAKRSPTKKSGSSTSSGSLIPALKKQTTLTAYFGPSSPRKTAAKRRKLVSNRYDSDSEAEVPPDEPEEEEEEEAEFSNRSSSSSEDDLAMGGGGKSEGKGWLSKAKRPTTTKTEVKAKKDFKPSSPIPLSIPKVEPKVPLPPPPSLDFQVHRRAVLSSDEEQANDNVEDEQETAKNKTPTASASSTRKTILLSEEEEEELEQKHEENGAAMEVEEAPAAAEDETEWLTAKKRKKNKGKEAKQSEEEGMLKKLKRKAEKMRNKQKKKRGGRAGKSDDEDDADDDEDADDSDRDMHADSFDSDDSDAGDHLSAKQQKVLRQLEQQCVEFVNGAEPDELKGCEKFNERFVAFVMEKRPFADFKELKAKATEASSGGGRRGAGGNFVRILDNYLEWLQNRGVLDKVLDDCRENSKAIEKALEEAKNKPPVQRPPGLNPECSLHPYQQVGLNWLILMSKLGMNAILADEMGLGKTIQVIAFLAWAKDQQEVDSRLRGPHLVVVPSSTIENWMAEIATWAPSLRMLTYYGSIEERQQLRHSARRHAVDLVLTTYNMVISRPEDRKFFKKFSLNYVIYDEGHMLRNCATQRYMNLMKVRGKRKILLTGTPLQNNLVELISLLYFTMRKLFDKYCEDIASLLQMFAVRSNILMGEGKGNSATTKKKGRRKSKAEDEEQEVEQEQKQQQEGEGKEEAEGRSLYEKHKIAQAKHILQPFVLRRLKIEVLKCLPAKHERVELCALTGTQADIYAELVDNLRARRALNGTGDYRSGILDLMMQLRQVANHPLLYRRHYDDDKVTAMARALCQREKFYEKKRADYVAEDLAYETDIALHLLCKKFGQSIGRFALDEQLALESGKCRVLDELLPAIVRDKNEKVLIFSQFTSLLDILELYMHCRQYKFLRMDGSTPVLERQELINKFNKSPSIAVFLLSTKAGGLGINLTAANHIIIHDIDFNPYNDKQAEDRCHRMGQTKDVHVIRLIGRDTIEEQMLALAQQKLELERNVTSSSSGGGINGQAEKGGDFTKKALEELLLSQALEPPRQK